MVGTLSLTVFEPVAPAAASLSATTVQFAVVPPQAGAAVKFPSLNESYNACPIADPLTTIITMAAIDKIINLFIFFPSLGFNF